MSAHSTLRRAVESAERHLRRVYVQAKRDSRNRDLRRETDAEIRAGVRGLITETATD